MTAIHSTLQAQRDFFATGRTKDVSFRLAQLDKLKAELLRREQDINAALEKDLHKSPFETYETETGIVLSEISDMQRHLKRWAKPKRVPTPLAHFPAHSRIYPEPYGVVLVMAPWNYPLQLALAPLVGALAAGNCAVVKPSNYAPATSALIAEMLAACFPAEYVTTVLGGREANQNLLNEKFDYIFFTGGVTVGKVVMEAASHFLTPVTLELGGKSPCIVDETANLKMAAKRIAWGKCINGGQTCVAPDYLLVHEGVKDALLPLLGAEITKFFGEHPETHADYPRMVNQKHFDRVSAFLTNSGAVAFGGKTNPETLQIAPTLLEGVGWEDPVMQEEIFGPVLPVLTFRDIAEVPALVNARPKPLALYYFTTDKARARHMLEAVSFGGGCINETIMHLASSHLPFGGVGDSGMGAYHGKYSFDTFSHHKGVVHKANWMEPPIRYAPYRPLYQKILRLLLR